jgi:PAS domain S-box-containing protein
VSKKASGTTKTVKVEASQRELALLAEVKRLEDTVRAQQVMREAIYNSLSEGLIVVDAHGMIAQINSYALSALGGDEAEIVGSWFPRAIIGLDHYGLPIDPLSRAITKALTEGKVVTEHTNYKRSDGSAMPAVLSAAPIVIDGRPIGAIEVFRDLTKERQLDLAKDDFVSIASHQLRTPASGIRGILAMLQAGDFGDLNDRQAKYVRLAILSNNRQMKIIEDLLSVARADSGTMELALDYVDIAALVREVATEHDTGMREKGQQLTLEVPERMYTIADAPKIQMVIDNLLSNASKYTPEGGRVVCQLEPIGEQVEFRVCDTGVGIASEHLDSIFSKFQRVDNELAAAGDGTGLGLYLAKTIISLHNGNIVAQPNPDVGTTFSFRIPNLQESQRR